MTARPQHMSRRLGSVMALGCAVAIGAIGGGTVATATANEAKGGTHQGWQLKYSESFGKPIPDAPWFRDDYSDPVDPITDDNGDRWRLSYGPNFDAAMQTFDTYRKEAVFGRDGWLTASLSARDSHGRSDDSFSTPDDRPTISNETLPGAGRVAAIDVPKHTGGAIIRSTDPLPRYYRIEYHLKTLDYGGERNGSIFYDGKVNGYGAEGCKTFYPWPDRNATLDPIVPSDPCQTDSVREDSPQAYNAFHFLSILDFPPMPRNLAMYHWHRKVLMDQFAPAPSRTVGGYEVCNSETGEYYPWEQGNRTTVNMLFFNDPQGRKQTFVTSCDDRAVAGGTKSAGELQPELMPKEDYTFAIERDETGYALEVSGNFRHVGEQTYKFHRNFVDTDIDNGVVKPNVPIFHYNVAPDEYDGRFNSAITVNGAYGSKTWPDQWPAGSAYPDYFVLGEPYTNVGEGEARVDDVRLYVRKQ